MSSIPNGGVRKPKRLRIGIGESMAALAKTLAARSEEKKIVVRETPAPPENPRKVYRHSATFASLAVGARGFTLFDGRTSVFFDSFLQNSHVAREIQGVVGTLYLAADDKTLKKWEDIKLSYPGLSTVKEVPVNLDDDERKCSRCEKDGCHKWLAVKALSKALNFEFDEIVHT